MNFFTGIVLTFGLIMTTVQIAPVVGDHYKSVASKAMAAKYEADKEQRLIKACATGKISYIMYNGRMCKDRVTHD